MRSPPESPEGMRRLRHCLLPALIFICFLQAHSQDKPVVRIGVPPVDTQPKTVSPEEARDRLVKSLDQLQRKKNSSIIAVPLEPATAPGSLQEAKQKKCDFILATRISSVRTSSALVNNGAAGMDYVPTYDATIEYRLIHVADGVGVTIGSARQQDAPDVPTAIFLAIHLVAGQAIAAIEQNASGTSRASGLNQPGAARRPSVTTGADLCNWLPIDFPHADAVRNVCQFAATVSQKMPDFICDQEASRFRGKNKVPFDLVTASVRYENGVESYGNIKVNGKTASSAMAQTSGLWSTGEFGSNNLRSIFEPENHAMFRFLKDGSTDGRPVWIFTYKIAKQNDPLWRLHTAEQVLAPPYGGELWVDQQNGQLLHFDSAAIQIPRSFGMDAASLAIDYENVAFADGAAFLLPTNFVVATRFKDQEPTRNVVRFRSCHKFRATAQIVLNVPGKESDTSAAESESDAVKVARDLDQEEGIYAILREQAVRDDDSAVEAERRLEMNVATVSALSRLARMEKIREKRSEQIAASSPSAHAPSIETTLKVSVRLVPVTVVLRDSKGNAMGNLRKEDFTLLDNGTPQPIKSFVLEQSKNSSTSAPALRRTETDSTQPPATDSSATPGRYVAYLFDDIHTSFEDLASARTAASHRVDALRPEDRVAIVTTSGQLFQDFTSDRGKLDQALQSLRPHPINHAPKCPPISPYMADLIVNQSDREALGLATRDAMNCAFAGMGLYDRAEEIAKSTAFEVLSTSVSEGQAVLSGFRNLVRQMSHMPGSRSIVMVSPGFLTPEVATRQGVADLIETALRSEIVVNTLDVRGLYTPVASPDSSHPANPVVRFRYDREEESSQSEILSNLAYSTGGTFFHNNNDLDEGFRRTAEAPEYVYMLGFSPAKLDGKYHKLKVRLNAPAKLTIQAREGYYALKPAPEPPKPGNPQ